MRAAPAPAAARPSGGGTEAPAAPPAWTAWAMSFGLLVLGLGLIGFSRTIDPDLFHEMALIREALALGRIPTDDPFAYTSTVSPVVHHEWGTGAVLYLFVVGLGLGSHGLVLLRFLLLGGIVAGCIAVARRRGAGWPEMALLAPVALLLFAPGLSPVRAHMFTFLLVATLLVLLERERAGDRRWLVLWPPLFVLWLNLHGGFVVGVGLLGLWTLERFVRTGLAEHDGKGESWRGAVRQCMPLLLVIGLTLPLLLVNPYGSDYIPYLWHALAMDRPYMTEWYPLWDPVFRGAPLVPFGVSVLVGGYTLLRGNRWRGTPGLLLLGATAVLALQSARILPIYALVWFAYVSPALSTTPVALVLRRGWRRLARPVAALAVVLAGLVLARIGADAFTVSLPTEPGDHRQLYPAGAVRYLDDTQFAGNLMTPFGVGAYVSWMLHPEVKVGMDSRYEVTYDPAFAEETMRVYRGGVDWRAWLDRQPTDALLVPAGSALDSIFQRLAPDRRAPPDPLIWTEVFRDDAYAVFARPEVADVMPRVDRTGERIPGTFP